MSQWETKLAKKWDKRLELGWVVLQLDDEMASVLGNVWACETVERLGLGWEEPKDFPLELQSVPKQLKKSWKKTGKMGKTRVRGTE